jgi:hypothetical protein
MTLTHRDIADGFDLTYRVLPRLSEPQQDFIRNRLANGATPSQALNEAKAMLVSDEREAASTFTSPAKIANGTAATEAELKGMHAALTEAQRAQLGLPETSARRTESANGPEVDAYFERLRAVDPGRAYREARQERERLAASIRASAETRGIWDLRSAVDAGSEVEVLQAFAPKNMSELQELAQRDPQLYSRVLNASWFDVSSVLPGARR